MSGVSAISSTASLWSTTSTASKTKSSSSVEDAYSQILSNLQSGAPAGGSGDSSDEDTVTMTQVLSDGSVLITVMQDGKVLSQTKTRAANLDDDATVIGTTTVTTGKAAHATGVDTANASEYLAAGQQSSLVQTVDKFNDTSTSILSGSLFASEV